MMDFMLENIQYSSLNKNNARRLQQTALYSGQYKQTHTAASISSNNKMAHRLSWC